MNEIMANNGNNPFRIFDYKNLGSVRTFVDERNEVWFCLIDVCRILEINHVATVANRLNRDGVVINHTIDTIGRNREITFINEPNLYETIFKSRKPEAEDLKQWVFNEVLPSLRKTGTYSLKPQSFSEIAAELLGKMSEEIVRIDKEIQNHIKVHSKDINNLNEYDMVLGSRMDRLEYDTNEMILENRRIEDSLRYDFKTVAGFFKYIGIQPSIQEELHFRGVVEEYCLNNRIPYCKTYVDGFGEYICFPFDTLMDVYNESIHNN